MAIENKSAFDEWREQRIDRFFTDLESKRLHDINPSYLLAQGFFKTTGHSESAQQTAVSYNKPGLNKRGSE